MACNASSHLYDVRVDGDELSDGHVAVRRRRLGERGGGDDEESREGGELNVELRVACSYGSAKGLPGKPWVS